MGLRVSHLTGLRTPALARLQRNSPSSIGAIGSGKTSAVLQGTTLPFKACQLRSCCGVLIRNIASWPLSRPLTCSRYRGTISGFDAFRTVVGFPLLRVLDLQTVAL